MNLSLIIRDSWRITWRCWQLWLINLLLFTAFIPAGLLAGGIGAAAALISLPFPGPAPLWLRQLRGIPALSWAGIVVIALIVLVITTTISWMFQAASMRGAAMAAERGTFSLMEALALGRQRIISLMQLSLTFGIIIAALSLIPPFALILLAGRFEFGIQLMNLGQALLAPVNMLAGIALMLVMMSIALEDLKPSAAFKRAGKVFRVGWWGFVFVFGATIAMTIAIIIFLAPFFFIPIFFIVPLSIASPLAGLLATLACFGVLVPIGIALMLFIAVFTIVLYTLTYREAARLAAP